MGGQEETSGIRLWLDDVRLPPKGWVWAKTAKEAIALLATGKVVECSLDHDLADEHYDSGGGYYWGPPSHREMTGYDVVLYMAEHSIWPTIVRVHSANPVGAWAMAQVTTRWSPESLKPKMYSYDSHEPSEEVRLADLHKHLPPQE